MFYDVLTDNTKMDEMLKLSDGKRKVPVIVTNGKASIGYQGGS